ncbi:hypothetical protein M9H77_03441 [Catharanthus roseus]|uniref:Uncharacterized protein n=1 Tax=Catharanthus roseus TaxID=4058 RepID=A0ACC0CBR9_CATRO|nr:hypothetical protein M9H77_03441 [Catharanthus roseus]
MHSFHHGGGNGFNVYGGNNHGNGNSTSKRHNGVGNFSSYAKSYGHTSYDDYGGYDRDHVKYYDYEHSPYDCYKGYHHNCVAKVEIMKPSLIEEFSKVNELPQATIEVEKSAVQHVKEEISNVEHCDFMRDQNIEKESIEIKEKERAEEKEKLVEGLCIFGSISTFSKESEHFECSKEKESELEKSERVKPNECFIEKQESAKEEQREKEIVILEKNEEVNVYANDTNSFFASESLCVQNF